MSDANQMYRDVVLLVQNDCPQADPKIVERAVVDALRYVASETCLLQTSVFPTLEESVPEYDFEELIPEGFELCDVRWVKYCGDCIDPVNECQCGECGYEFIDDTCIKLHPEPVNVEPGQLEIKVVVQPTYQVCWIPKEYRKYQKHIHDLATVFLQKMPKKPWTDMRAAAASMSMLEGYMAEISARVSRRLAPERARHNKLTVR